MQPFGSLDSSWMRDLSPARASLTRRGLASTSRQRGPRFDLLSPAEIPVRVLSFWEREISRVGGVGDLRSSDDA